MIENKQNKNKFYFIPTAKKLSSKRTAPFGKRNARDIIKAMASTSDKFGSFFFKK